MGVDPEDESTWDSPEQVAACLTAGPGIDPLFHDPRTVRRFLIAQRGNPDEAAKMLLRHQQWRKEITPWWPLTCAPIDVIKGDILSGKAYLHGHDKKRRPVAWIRTKLHDANEDRKAIETFISFVIDESVARCDRPTSSEQFLVVIDFQDFGWSNFDKDTAIYILKMLKYNFPERMYKLFFVRESWLFWALWKVIEVFIDARTAKKINFCGSNFLPMLLQDIDESVIPQWLGGKSDYAYQPEHVLPAGEPGGAALPADSAGNSTPNPHYSVLDGPRAHLPFVKGSGFRQSQDQEAPQ